MAIFAALFFMLCGRLFYLQLIASEELQRIAQAQWTSESVIAPLRGSITDRNGSVIAMSATAYTASVNPRQVKNAGAMAEILAPILNMEAHDIVKKAGNTSRASVILKRQLPRETAQQLKMMLAQHREMAAMHFQALCWTRTASGFIHTANSSAR